LAKMCMKFNFISICTYLCGVYPMYCSCLTTSDPISLGTTLCLIFVLGTMEIHWKLVLFIMKVVWSSYNWRQAMMIGKLISTSSLQCYLGNKYLSHAYTYHPTLCRLYIMAWDHSFANLFLSLGIISLRYLLPCSNYFNYLLVPLLVVVMNLMCCVCVWSSFNVQ
jgi:hypothetical protein